jgi:pyruvate formate lyase activating enzyme
MHLPSRLTAANDSVSPAGTIFDLKQYAIHDGPGIRTTVFFKGCPLDCAWCHNPESRLCHPEPVHHDRSHGSSMIGCTVTVDSIIEQVRRDEIFYDQSGGGVTVSGGEPLLQPKFLAALLSRCRSLGIHTAVDTCGYAPWESFEPTVALTNLWLYDLKPMDDTAHRKHTDVSNELIHANLRRLHESAANVMIRLPLIPEITDTEKNLEAVASLLDTLPRFRSIALLPYNKLGVDKARRYRLNRPENDWSPQSDQTIAAISQRFASRGFSVRIGG